MIIELDGKPLSHARKANAKASGGRGALRRDPFHGKRLLRREYHGLMAIVMSLFVLELVSDFWVGKALEIDLLWTCLLTSTLMGYIVVRSVHQRTAWL